MYSVYLHSSHHHHRNAQVEWNKKSKEYTTSIPSPRTPKDMFVASVYEYAEKDKMEVLKKTASTIDVAG